MARKFSDLRARAIAGKSGVLAEAAAALRQIGATPPGDALREYLASEIFDTTEVPGEGAWREKQARRKFAEQLINMMDGKKDDDRDARSGKNPRD